MRVALTALVLFVFDFQTLNAQLYTYSGEVKIRTERITIAFGSGSDAGYDWNVNVDEKWIIDGTFFVSFSGYLRNVPHGMPLMFKLTSIDRQNFNFENSASNLHGEGFYPRLLHHINQRNFMLLLPLLVGDEKGS